MGDLEPAAFDDAEHRGLPATRQGRRRRALATHAWSLLDSLRFVLSDGAGPVALSARLRYAGVGEKLDTLVVFFSETVLAPGDAVYALGEASLDSGGPVPAAYRDRPSRILVVTAPAGGELLLGDDERAVAAQLAVRRTILWCAAAGLVVVGAFPAIAAALGH